MAIFVFRLVIQLTSEWSKFQILTDVYKIWLDVFGVTRRHARVHISRIFFHNLMCDSCIIRAPHESAGAL